jgi:hypothetical protein
VALPRCRPLLEVRAVAAAVTGDAAVPDLHDRAGDPVEEQPVVGDGHHRAAVGAQLALQPGKGLLVEMVGGLVEQHQLRRGGQQAGQAQPCALAAGEARELSAAVGRAQAQGLQRPVRTGVGPVSAARFVRGEQVAVLGHPLLGQVRLQLAQAPFHGAESGERFVDGLADGACGGRHRGLAEVADAAGLDAAGFDAAGSDAGGDGHGHRAVVRGLLARDQAQKRGLAGAVVPDDGYVFTGPDGERDAVQDGASGVGLRDVLERELGRQGGGPPVSGTAASRARASGRGCAPGPGLGPCLLRSL